MWAHKRKVVSLVLAALLVLSVTATAFAAAYDVTDTTTGVAYGLWEYTDDIGLQFDLAEHPENFTIEVGGKQYKLDQVLAVMEADEDISIDDAVVGLVPIDEEPGEELKVVSVSAINAKKLEVKFSQEVNKTEAEKINDNYTIVGLDLTNATAKLQDDNKTVIITLGKDKEIENNTTFVVTVKPIPSKADPKVKSPLFTKTITFSDTVKPTLVDVKYPQAGIAVLNFSEELKDAGTVTVFDNGEEAEDVEAALTEDGKGIKLTGLEANKEYRVVVLGAKDWSNNLITPNPIEITVKSTVVDNVKPQVVSIEAVGLDTLKIKFSEPLQNLKSETTDKKDTYVTLTGGVTQKSGTDQVFDSKTNTVTVELDNVQPGVKAVTVSGYKDLAGNEGKPYTKNVVFKEIVPEVEKIEVVKEDEDTFVKLTFNTDVAFVESNKPAITGTLVTPENVLKNVEIEAKDYNVDTEDAKIVKIKVTDEEPGNYKLTIPKGAFGDPKPEDNIEIEFTLEAAVDTTVPTVAVKDVNDKKVPDIEITNKTVTIKYTLDMGQSALDVNNYKVSGQKVFEKAIFDGNKKTVKLTFKEGSIKYNGEYELEISTNVKAENGVPLKETYKYTSDKFKENVPPTITKAQFNGADKIVLTFSEKVKLADEASGGVTGIEVYVNGAKVDLADGITIDITDGKTLTLVPEGDATEFVDAEDFATANVEVKVLKTNNIIDENGNELKPATVTVEK